MKKAYLTDVLRPTLLAAAAVALAAGTAVAQTSGPAGGGSGGSESPQTRNPFWGNNGDRDAGGGDRNGGDESSFRDEFPADLAADVPETKERYVALRAAYRSAQARLNARLANFRTDFEGSAEYQQFLDERTAAQAALEEARADALAPLENDADYQADGEIYERLQRQIKEAHEADRPDMGKIRGMSELALEYATRRKAKEQALTADDSRVLAAKDRLQAAGRRQGDVEAQYNRTVRQDEELEQLRRQVDELRIGYLAAGARYDSTVQAADIAADFAYFRAAASSRGNYQPYGYGNAGYGGYGYGGGYGTGYGIPYGGGYGYSPFYYGGNTLYGGFVNLNGGAFTPVTPGPLGNSISGGPRTTIVGGIGNTMVPGAAGGQ